MNNQTQLQRIQKISKDIVTIHQQIETELLISKRDLNSNEALLFDNIKSMPSEYHETRKAALQQAKTYLTRSYELINNQCIKEKNYYEGKKEKLQNS